MDSFEYRVTMHPAEAFREMIYFCSHEGSCNMEVITSGQLKKMESLLNEGGKQGWELVQATFGKDGVLVFWKRLLYSPLDIPQS
ncbi:MAG: hypothetical protein AB9866_28820 [Syntrophobacteraceae bacterium]